MREPENRFSFRMLLPSCRERCNNIRNAKRLIIMGLHRLTGISIAVELAGDYQKRCFSGKYAARTGLEGSRADGSATSRIARTACAR